MGASNSQEEPSLEGKNNVGYRVLGVQCDSPAEKGGLVSFFDFIVAANGVALQTMDATFLNIIQEFTEQDLHLTVYNIKNKSFREVTLRPSRDWPGEGLLGVIIKFDSYQGAEESLCHVLEVESNSPAELAGLEADNDYLLGSAEVAFKDTELLSNVLRANIDRPIEVYVYNCVSDEVRIVVLMPNADWGGQGILGANVAHGILHVLPSSCCHTIGKSVVLAPLMEDDDQGQQDYQGQHDASENIRKEEPTDDDVSGKVIHENVREENTEQDIDYESGLPIVSVAVDMDIMHSKTRDEMESINQEASESAENRLETVSVAAKRD